MDYTPHTEEEIQAMLERVGAGSLEDLYRHLPKEVLNPEISLPESLPEWAVLEELKRLAGKNKPAFKAFLGGGVRSHHTPPRGPGPGEPGGVFDRLHPLPAGGEPGGFAGHL